MSNNKNSFPGSFTDHRTVPYNATLQGTISTVGKNVQGSYSMAYNTLVNTFQIGETVTGTTSGATGKIIKDTGTVLNMVDIKGIFVSAEALTGSIS